MASAQRVSLLVFDDNDFVPVTGGGKLHGSYLRSDTCALQDLKVASDTDRHLVRLLTLHPDMQVKFRCQDLALLDDNTKRDLLKDINRLLGIKSFRK